MVLKAEYLWGDDWPVAKRESNEADQEDRRRLEIRIFNRWSCHMS